MSPFLVSTDVVVLTPRGDPIALVETKNREDLSREVAMILRRNLVAHGLAKRAPYFLLVSQDRGFLWDEGAGGEPERSLVPTGFLTGIRSSRPRPTRSCDWQSNALLTW